jgi:hypothetical protein
VGGVGDILAAEQADCVVGPEDVRGFTALCARALNDPALLDSWRRAGEKQVECFAEARVLEAFMRMIAGRPVGWNWFLSGEDQA